MCNITKYCADKIPFNQSGHSVARIIKKTILKITPSHFKSLFYCRFANRAFRAPARLARSNFLENNTKRTLGLANYVNFTRLNKYLERRLANITTKDNMLAALKESSKLFPDAAALYFELKNSDNSEVWFEHFRKNAYTMVSSQKKTKNHA